jgi:hypothetical protein
VFLFLFDEYNQKNLIKIKAINKFEDVHLVQALNYLKTYKLEVGLLINFGSKSKEFKRLFIFNPRNLIILVILTFAGRQA